jgi:hypothetical protein
LQDISSTLLPKCRVIRYCSLDAGGDSYRRPAGTGLQKYGPGRGSLRAGLDRDGGSYSSAVRNLGRLGTTGLIPPAFAAPPILAQPPFSSYPYSPPR